VGKNKKLAKQCKFKQWVPLQQYFPTGDANHSRRVYKKHLS